jgi:HD-like signal output (HDOD) protein
MSTPAQNPAIQRWVADMAGRKLPVLRNSIRALELLRRDEDSVKPREVAQAVLRDPMLTLIVLRHLRSTHSRRMLEDITTVEHAIMMLGIQRFFSAFESLPAVEDLLQDRPEALAGLMQVVVRARSAAAYAGTLAGLRADLTSDEVIAAAQLHDMAELLLWCFAPDAAASIAARQRSVSGLRSADAQREVLGFTLLELQLALVRHWGLPELFLSLMDDSHAERPRVRNVALAVALARHAANGWDDAALPSDIEEISRLVALPLADVRAHLFEAALRAIAERAWYGGAAAVSHLPPLPREDSAAGVATDAATLDNAMGCLRGIARGTPRRGQPRAGLTRDARHERLAALAALMDGMTAGLGFARAMLLALEPQTQRWQPRYVAGRSGMERMALEQDSARGMAEALRRRTPLAQLRRSDEGVTLGEFILPVLAGQEVVALAIALQPADATRLAPANVKRFKDLALELERALLSLEDEPAAPGGKGAKPSGGRTVI